MGYSLIIGEAMFDGDKTDLYMHVWAEVTQHKDFPRFENDATDGNWRDPGYSVWSEFCRDVGLFSMFYGLNGRRNPYMEGDPACHREIPILADHPGYAVIGPEDVSAIRVALDKHVEKHGILKPGFRPWNETKSPPNAEACANRARLLWLYYWCDWAVTNCEWPVIANT